MSERAYRNIIKKYLSRKANKEEIRAFFENVSKPEFSRILSEMMDDDIKANLEEESDSTKETPVCSERKWKAFAGAAVLLMLFSLSLYLWLNRQDTFDAVDDSSVVYIKAADTDTERLQLTLSDGRIIDLEDEKASETFLGGNWGKDQKGTLVYKADERQAPLREADLKYHQIKTPKRKSLHLQLPDGSEVWLNASSSIRFPESFLANKRRIQVDGEVYIKVKKDKDRPFYVETDHQLIEVLGTEFNVEAYGNSKEVRTTLINGKVHVKNEFHQMDITPGQQSVLNIEDHTFQAKRIDTNDVIAWKEGFFKFNNIDLESIMIQISRWYGVDIEFQRTSKELFVGRFPRDKSLEEFMDFLQKANIKSELKANTLIIGI